MLTFFISNSDFYTGCIYVTGVEISVCSMKTFLNVNFIGQPCIIIYLPMPGILTVYVVRTCIDIVVNDSHDANYAYAHVPKLIM